MHTEFFSLGLDVVSALRETVQGFLVDPLSIGAENLEGAMFSGYFGFVAEPLELFTQDGIRHRAQHRAGLIHRAVVPGAPSIIARDLAGLRVDSIGVTELLGKPGQIRSEEHTSELQSLMRIP